MSNETLHERLDKAIRGAGLGFEGDWIREHLIPSLHAEGLEVCDIEAVNRLEARVAELENPEGCGDYPAPCNCDEPCEVAR